MLEVMYELPARSDAKRCIVTRETVVNREEPMLVVDSGPVTDGRKKKKKEETA